MGSKRQRRFVVDVRSVPSTLFGVLGVKQEGEWSQAGIFSKLDDARQYRDFSSVAPGLFISGTEYRVRTTNQKAEGT